MTISIIQGRKPHIHQQMLCASCGKQEFTQYPDDGEVRCNHCGHPLPKRMSMRILKNASLLSEYRLSSSHFASLNTPLIKLREDLRTAMGQISVSTNPETAIAATNATKIAADAAQLTKNGIEEIGFADRQLRRFGGIKLDKPGMWRILNRITIAWHNAVLARQNEIKLTEEALRIARGSTSTNIGSKQP